MKKITTILSILLFAGVVIGCKNKVPAVTEPELITVDSVDEKLDITPPLPKDRLDSLVYDVVTRLQHFADTNEYFKGIEVASYAELKDMRYTTGVYEIFTRYDRKNVWGEVEKYSGVYSVILAKESYVEEDSFFVSTGEDQGYISTHKNKIKKGEIVVKDGEDILFHTKNLSTAQSKLYEELVGAVYGPSHQPPVKMTLTGFSATPGGKLF
jgi:hypothetical protein